MPAGAEFATIQERLSTRRQTLLDEVTLKLSDARTPTNSDQADILIEEGDMATADLLSHTSIAEGQRDLSELHEIEEALVRIEDGDYGDCIHCGASIDRARLQAIPTAKRCIRCQEAYEKQHATQPTPSI